MIPSITLVSYFASVVIGIITLSSQNNGVKAAVLQPEQYHVTSFTAEELHHGSTHTDTLLKDILTTTGILSIRIPVIDSDNNNNNNLFDHPRQNHHNANNVLNGLCDCQPNLGSHIQGGKEFVLDDGSTIRKTIATATNGTDRPIPLPREDIVRECSVDTYDDLERARMYVSKAVSSAFLPAFDRLMDAAAESGGGDAAGSSWRNHLLDRNDGDSFPTVTSIVKDAMNLEHFHAYSKHEPTSTNDENNDSGTTYALEYHTDGGLFLAFLPAEVCAREEEDNNNRHLDDNSFFIKHPDTNKELQAIFPSNNNHKEITVAIMLGAGSEQWLQTPPSLPLRATRHAVKMNSNDVRVWYGRMHLVPTDAIVQTHPNPVTFAEWRQSSSPLVHSDSLIDHTMQNISANIHDDDKKQQQPSSFYRRSRILQGVSHDHVDGQDDCGFTSFYCWISCLDVPSSSLTVQEHVAKNESLYCVDPSVFSETQDLKQAIDACADDSGIAGSEASRACGNRWYDTVDGLVSYTDGLYDTDSNIMGTLSPTVVSTTAPTKAPTNAPSVGRGNGGNNYSFRGIVVTMSLVLMVQLFF